MMSAGWSTLQVTYKPRCPNTHEMVHRLTQRGYSIWLVWMLWGSP